MSLTLKPYPEYKDSGIPWLGEIPSHWRIERAKWLFKKMDRRIDPSHEVVTCFRDGVVTLRKNRRTEGFTESIQEVGYQGVRQGDLVIHAMDAFAGAVGVSDSDGKCTPVYAVCKPKRDANPHYYARVVREMARNHWITALAKGIRERSTDFRYEAFANQPLPVPPMEEQKRIESLLALTDTITYRLIRAKQRLIELLNEQKQAIIHQAVTRGLDPNVPMKPTGLDWLPKVPEHWEISKLKHVAQLRSGDSITSSQINETGTYPVFGGNGLRGYTSDYTHEGEYVLIGRQGALCGNVNYASEKFWASEHAVVASPIREQDVFWFGELLRTMNLNQYSQSAAQPGLSVERIENLGIPVPDYSEQKRISDWISAETSTVEAAVARAYREIELLREYRTRLISDVVTGKLDVREVDLPVLDEQEPDLKDMEHTNPKASNNSRGVPVPTFDSV